MLAPLIGAARSRRQDLSNILAAAGVGRMAAWDAPLGTDALGRDVASRLMYGARNSLLIAFFAVLIAADPGAGRRALVAGFSRGWMGRACSCAWATCSWRSRSSCWRSSSSGVITDRTPLHLILVLGIPGWILYARVVRARVLAERDKDYVTAARSLGAGRLRQLRRYVLPSVWQVVLVIALLDLGFVILVESTLSFLGLRAAARRPVVGLDPRRGPAEHAHRAVARRSSPGLAIMLTVLAVNLVADGRPTSSTPKLKQGAFRRRSPSARSSASDRRQRAAAVTGRCAGRSRRSSGCSDLQVEFPLRRPRRACRARRRASTSDAARPLGIVGESGSGKSVTALSIIQLLDSRAGSRRPDPVRRART